MAGPEVENQAPGDTPDRSAVWHQPFPWASSTTPPAQQPSGDSEQALPQREAAPPGKPTSGVASPAGRPPRRKGSEESSAQGHEPTTGRGAAHTPSADTSEERSAGSRNGHGPGQAPTALSPERPGAIRETSPAEPAATTEPAPRRHRGATAAASAHAADGEAGTPPDSTHGTNTGGAQEPLPEHPAPRPPRSGLSLVAQTAGLAVLGSVLLAAPFAMMAGDNDRHSPQQGGEARGTRSAPDTPTELSGLSQDPEPAHTRARPEGRASSSPADRPAAATGETGRARESASLASNSKPHVVRSSSAPQNTGKPTGGGKGPSHSPTPTPAWTTTVVTREGQLAAGQSWRTNRITMTMQSDGDLVLYDEHGRARWAAGTKGVGRRVIMQGDGNLVIYDRRDRPVWTSGTAGHENAILCLQADGNVTILHQDRDLWSTNTHDR